MTASTPPPAPGDDIAVEEPHLTLPQRVFHRKPDGPWRILDGAQADDSSDGEFVVRGTWKETIISQPKEWSVTVNEDDESQPGMRRGRVQAEVYAY